MNRAVLDTNVYVSAFLFYKRRGVPVKLLHEAAEGRFTIVSCRPILDELEYVLTRNTTTQERYGYTSEMAVAYRTLMERQVVLVEPKLPFSRVSRDPDDDMIIATAIAGNADYVVTGDDDLLTLKKHQGVRIIKPKQFLDVLSQQAV